MDKKLEDLLKKLKHERVTQKTYCPDTPIYLVQTGYDIIVNENYYDPMYHKLEDSSLLLNIKRCRGLYALSIS